jgi:hypothetical protein
MPNQQMHGVMIKLNLKEFKVHMSKSRLIMMISSQYVIQVFKLKLLTMNYSVKFNLS